MKIPNLYSQEINILDQQTQLKEVFFSKLGFVKSEELLTTCRMEDAFRTNELLLFPDMISMRRTPKL